MTHTVRLSQFEAMKKERDELAAQVERLREALDKLTRAAEDVDTGYMDGPVDNANDALDETPAQSLREIRADAVDYAINQAAWYHDRVWMKIEDVKAVANQIRNGDD